MKKKYFKILYNNLIQKLYIINKSLINKFFYNKKISIIIKTLKRFKKILS